MRSKIMARQAQRAAQLQRHVVAAWQQTGPALPLRHGEAFDEGAGDVADGDMGFLDALGVAGGDVEEEIDFAGERAAGFSGESDEEGAASAAGFDAVNDVGAGTAGGNCNEHVLWCDQGFDLAREDLAKAIVISRGGQDGGIGGKSEGGKAFAIRRQTNDEFGGEVQRVGSAATVAEEDDLAASAQ